MVIVKNELLVLMRIVASFITAVLLVFFISALAGEDLTKNQETINATLDLQADIAAELKGGIAKRISGLGPVPEAATVKKFYSVELAKEIHELAQLTEKQRILFDSYNVRSFEDQLARIMGYTGSANVPSLMNEMEIVKRELRNAANLLEKKRARLTRQRTAYIVFFVVLWVVVFMYYSRGIILRKNEYE